MCARNTSINILDVTSSPLKWMCLAPSISDFIELDRLRNCNIFVYPANKSCGVYSFLVCSSVRHTYVNSDFSRTASHIVMKFCTLTHYIKDKTLQLKKVFLGNVCLSEKLRFTFLSTFLAHLARRAKWAIAITWCPSSSSSCRRRKLFQKSSPLKLLKGFTWYLVVMVYDILATKFPHFEAIR